MTKPLNKKAYGSIPHLIGSKLGEGDHHIHEGQHKICTEKVRDKNDLIVVQIKYDGSNVAVCRIDNRIYALTRSGHLAETSPYSQHHVFAKYVEKNKKMFMRVLENGQRLCGEWLYQAHGIKYTMSRPPFAPFDVMTGNDRLNYFEFLDVISPIYEDILHVKTVHIGGPCKIVSELIECDPSDFSRPEPIDFTNHEGLIYRVYRNHKFDFIAKWVRPDFVPGIYLPEISGKPEVINHFNNVW